MASLAAPVRLAATPSGSFGSEEGTGGTQAGAAFEEEVLALAAVAVVVALEPPLALDELALEELDELLPHAVSTQLTTTNAPIERTGRHRINRISTSLGR
jgi:hypothetical protein